MDFSKISDDFAREIVREGEAYLGGQLQIATSADQRAAVMASVFTAAGAALAAGVITIASSKDGIGSFPVFFGGTIASLLFLAGASCCVKATMPCDFWPPGSEPGNWNTEIVSGANLKDAFGEQSSHIQDKIDENSRVLSRNAGWFKWGARLGIAAPFFGILSWLLFTACRFIH